MNIFPLSYYAKFTAESFDVFTLGILKSLKMLTIVGLLIECFVYFKIETIVLHRSFYCYYTLVNDLSIISYISYN